MCLQKGGPSNPPNPPANTDCPYNWSWHSGAGCCTPHQPPSSLPPPQCGSGWNWTPSSYCCNRPPTPPTTVKPSAPSNAPYGGGNNGNPGHGNGHKRANIEKRDYRSRNVAPCPKGRSACPVTSLVGGDYECVDTLVDLDNCGGCAILGEGQNCNAIPGVWNVGCERSVCESKSSFTLPPWLRTNLTPRETSLYLCRRLHSFQRRKVLCRCLNPPVDSSSVNDLIPRWPLRPRAFL